MMICLRAQGCLAAGSPCSLNHVNRESGAERSGADAHKEGASERASERSRHRPNHFIKLFLSSIVPIMMPRLERVSVAMEAVRISSLQVSNFF